MVLHATMSDPHHHHHHGETARHQQQHSNYWNDSCQSSPLAEWNENDDEVGVVEGEDLDATSAAFRKRKVAWQEEMMGGSVLSVTDGGVGMHSSKRLRNMSSSSNNTSQYRSSNEVATAAAIAAAAATAAASSTAVAAAAAALPAWTESTHRKFVESIYDIGLKNASPSVIMENMTEHHQALTSERVKSHLQKYRNNKDKSKQEFLAEYESWMQKALTVGAAAGAGCGNSTCQLAPPPSILNMMMSNSSHQLLGGDLAAFLSYTAMYEEFCELQGEEGNETSNNPSDLLPSKTYSDLFTEYGVAGAAIPFPMLTEEERKSPLGVSISHVVSLFYSMTQHILEGRKLKEKEKGDKSSDELSGEKSNLSEENLNPSLETENMAESDNPTQHHENLYSTINNMDQNNKMPAAALPELPITGNATGRRTDNKMQSPPLDPDPSAFYGSLLSYRPPQMVADPSSFGTHRPLPPPPPPTYEFFPIGSAIQYPVDFALMQASYIPMPQPPLQPPPPPRNNNDATPHGYPSMPPPSHEKHPSR